MCTVTSGKQKQTDTRDDIKIAFLTLKTKSPDGSVRGLQVGCSAWSCYLGNCCVESLKGC